MDRNRKLRSIIAMALAVSLLCACAAGETQTPVAPEETVVEVPEEEQAVSAKEDQEAQEVPEKADEGFAPDMGKRPKLLGAAPVIDVDVTPSAAPYEIASDLSNVVNLEQFYLEDGMKEKLAGNGFVVCGDAGWEFYEIYEDNRYSLIPNFVTVDSLMHTYHLYFAYLLKGIEKNHLSETLAQLSRQYGSV